MWKEVENGKADETRVEKTRRKRGKERKEKGGSISRRKMLMYSSDGGCSCLVDMNG